MSTAARRAAVAGAALGAVLTTGGCFVGPTIADETPAATAAGHVAPGATGGMGAEPPSGILPVPGTDGDPGPATAPPARGGPQRLPIGGTGAYEMDGAALRVDKVVSESSLSDGRVLVAVHLTVRAGASSFKSRSAQVRLLACSERFNNAECPPPNGPDRRESDRVAAGTTESMVRLFVASSSAFAAAVVTVGPFGLPAAEFVPAASVSPSPSGPAPDAAPDPAGASASGPG